MLQDLDSIAKSARSALIAVYYVKLCSLTSLEHAEVFGKNYLPRIIVCLSKSHNIRTRSNALKCFVKVCQQLIFLGSNERLARRKIFFFKNTAEVLKTQDSMTSSRSIYD